MIAKTVEILAPRRVLVAHWKEVGALCPIRPDSRRRFHVGFRPGTCNDVVDATDSSPRAELFAHGQWQAGIQSDAAE